MDRIHDVIVVGGGPAGAQLAIRLARAGRDVVVLDRMRFPRAKPCGEFLGPECIPILDELGLVEPVLAAGARAIRSMTLVGHGRRTNGRFGTIGRSAAQAPEGRALSREALDELTLREAERSGADVREGWSVGGLLRDASGAVTGVRATDPGGESRELRARFTVGADGIRSRVARELGTFSRVDWLDRMALSVRVEDAPVHDRAEVHFVPGGYFAIAPIEGGRSTLNLVLDRAEFGGGRSVLRERIEDRLEHAPELRAWLPPIADDAEILAIGPLACRTRSARSSTAPHSWATRAGQVDPLTGEGLYIAMRGAALLAESLASALAAGRTDAGALAPYARARKREFAHRRALALALQRGLRHPSVVGGVLAVLAARPRITDLLMGMTGTSVPPRELLRPSVWYDLLRRPSAAASTGGARG
ncbi:MAG: FAD-dependent monooxygenase [Planctomycetota bacterium]